MLDAGAFSVRFEHAAPKPNGQWCRWKALKKGIPGMFTEGFGSLAITRPIVAIEQPAVVSNTLLRQQMTLLEQLDSIDHMICQGIALGDLTPRIANTVGMTRRSVEVRTVKILEHFGFSRKVQIVRLIVRLEENGLLDT